MGPTTRSYGLGSGLVVAALPDAAVDDRVASATGLITHYGFAEIALAEPLHGAGPSLIAVIALLFGCR